MPKFVVDEGMYPKLDAAEVAIGSRRVGAVHILKADGPALLDEVLTRTGSGTMIERFQSVLIDTATEADVESIEALLQEAQKFTTPKGTSYLKPRSRAEILNDLAGTLVFKHQGVPVGTICYTNLQREQDTAVIRSFAVAENHQSSQYGRVLLEACLDTIRKRGFRRAISITAADQLKHLYMQYGATKDEGEYADVLAPSLQRYDATERDMLHLYMFDMTADKATA
jgi:N-acetylglutamate synthase-like GNAT family acetyltransferase